MMLFAIKVILGVIVYVGFVTLIAKFISVCTKDDDKYDQPENLQVNINKECSNCCHYDNDVKACKIHNSDKLCKDYKYI